MYSKKKWLRFVGIILISILLPSNHEYCVAQAPVSVVWVDEIVMQNRKQMKADYEKGQQEQSVKEWKELQEKKRLLREKRRQERLERERKRKEMLAKKKKEQRRETILACLGGTIKKSEREVLERIVEAEAGGEDFTGKVLVANVILNRVKSPSFPSTIKEVVFAHSGSRYQFSPISDGRYYTVNISNETKAAVKEALNGEDPSQGALYFMERSIADSDNVTWFDRCLTRLFRHDSHEFYK